MVGNVEDFIRLIQVDRVLTGMDIAKYILSKQPCTHLKLQKLVYYCFADYLCEAHDKLFQDEIYAFELGPVIQSVREKFKGFRYIDTENIDVIEEASF